MKRLCNQCGKKPVYVVRTGGKRDGTLEHHDLCDRCYRAQRNQVVAHRQLPKPNWAYGERATLLLLAKQGHAHETAASG